MVIQELNLAVLFENIQITPYFLFYIENIRKQNVN